MKPGDRFFIVNRNKTSFDERTFARLYLPILGKTATALYGLILTINDGKFSQFLELLNCGQVELNQALDRLSGLDLLKVFATETGYQLQVLSPRNYEDFLADNFFKQLLISKIGEDRVTSLLPTVATGKEISKRFSEVYSVTGRPRPVKVASSLDLESFKRLMVKENLQFVNENQDSLQLYNLSEKFGLDWYQLFKLAESTANADHSLNLARMMESLTQQVQSVAEVPAAYQSLVQIAKAEEPLSFIQQLKRQVGGFVSADEQKLLLNLTKQQIAPEVQNILIHYILIQRGNASLTAKLMNPVANDWLRQKVTTAELAVKRILDFNIPKKSKSKKAVKAEPDWSNPNYKNETSPEELERLQQLQRAALEKIGGSDGINS